MNFDTWFVGIVLVIVYLLLAAFCGDTGGGPPRFFGDTY